MEDYSGNPQYDAATANWGEGWRMHTRVEQNELYSKYTWERITVNGVMGMQVTGPNGKSVFLPSAGYNEMYILKHPNHTAIIGVLPLAKSTDTYHTVC